MTAFINAQGLSKSPFIRTLNHLSSTLDIVECTLILEKLSSWQLKKQNSVVSSDVCVQKGGCGGKSETESFRPAVRRGAQPAQLHGSLI